MNSNGSIRLRGSAALLVALALLAPPAAQAANLFSTFTSDDEGWRVWSLFCPPADCPPYVPTYNSTGGPDGGWVGVTDAATDSGSISSGNRDGSFWVLKAPAAWTGNLGANYGGTLSFDIKDDSPDRPPELYLEGPDGSVLVFLAAATPGTDWTAYSVPMTPNGGGSDGSTGFWFFSSQPGGTPAPPTRDEFLSVLRDVRGIYLMGDVAFGSGHTTGLDRIRLAEPPTPVDSDGLRDSDDACPERSDASAPRSPRTGCPADPPPADSPPAGSPPAADPDTAGGGNPQGTAPPDATPPALTGVSQLARTWAGGTSFSFSVSEPARVVLTFERILPGRRVRSICRRPSRSNRRHRRCSHYRTVGRVTHEAVAGENTKRFNGRIDGRRLPPGSYRVTLVATDAAGNASAPAQLRFEIVRR